jgi:hypothetical protein
MGTGVGVGSLSRMTEALVWMPTLKSSLPLASEEVGLSAIGEAGKGKVKLKSSL